MNPLHRVVSEHEFASERGASLVEALLAALLLSTAVAAMAQLMAIAGSTNIAARGQTVATILAAQKLEQLSLLASNAGLAAGGSLTQNASGFVEHIDSNGMVVGVGGERPPGAVYTRRWAILQASSSPQASWVVQVRVVQRGTLAQFSTVRWSRHE